MTSNFLSNGFALNGEGWNKRKLHSNDYITANTIHQQLCNMWLAIALISFVSILVTLCVRRL